MQRFRLPLIVVTMSRDLIYSMAKQPARRRVLALAFLALAVSSPSQAQDIPLPRPRPAEVEAVQPERAPEPEPELPSACRQALTEDIAVAPSLPPIVGPGACGGTDMVRLEAIVLPDASRVALKPAATLRCEMATAVAQWVREDMAPLAGRLGSSLREMDNFDSYDCRGRNRVAGALISEHGKANAIDVRGFRIDDGRALSFTDRALAIETRESVKASACARFTTVLGPGSDWYHEDHIHFDLAQRRSGYRLCQWDIWEPLPAVVPLPPERPEDAPQREEEKADKPAVPELRR
jgi:hypothetical protein